MRDLRRIQTRWENEVVTFELPGAPGPGCAIHWHLRASDGRSWPAQIESLADGEWAVHTGVDLEPDEVLDLRLEQAEAKSNPFSVEDRDSEWTIRNGVIEVRVPKPTTFQAGEAPAPVLSGRMVGDDWTGRGFISGLKWVGEVHSQLVSAGPVLSRWIVRYALGGKTAATFVCTLYRSAEFVRIEDTSSTDFDLCMEYALGGRDAPDALISHGQGEHPQKRRDLLYETDGKVFHIDFNSGWHQMSNSWCGVCRAGRATMVGVLEMRGGSWTKVGRNRIEVHESTDRTLTIRAPLRGGSKQWALMFSPVEANVVADGPNYPAVRTHLGETHRKWSELPLDKVRTWNLDWRPPLPSGRLRLFGGDRLDSLGEFRKDQPEVADVFLRHAAAALDKDEGALNSHDANALAARWLLTREPESARRAKVGLLGDLRQMFRTTQDYGYHHLIIFHGRSLKLDLQTFDILDAAGRITDDERNEICRIVAFLAHCFRDRDYFPFELNMLEREDEQSWAPDLWDEIGDALCPPNFMTEYITSFGMAGCMFPDHPDAETWRQDAVALYTKQLERHYYDGGAYCESFNYHHHNLVMTLQFAAALRENGAHDFFEHPRFRAQFSHWVDLMTPPVVRNEAGAGQHSPENSVDAGAERLRMIPSNGNTGRDCSDHPVPPELALAAGILNDSSPDYSKRLMRAWREGGRVCLNSYNVSSFLLLADPALPESERLGLQSKLLPGVGAALRGSAGGPDEVYALVKCGWATHHNDKDEGGFCIWAYGAPVSSDQGYHYNELDGQTYGGVATHLHNCISFDQKSPALAGQETAFPPERFVTTDLADLLIAYLPVDYFMDLPKRSYLELIPCERIEYRRFVLFVKPHYFLIYDHLPVNVYPTEWYLHCQSTSVTIDGAEVRFRGNWGVDLAARILLPEAPVIQEGQFGVQRHVVVRQAGPKDFFAWVAPLKEGMAFDLRQDDGPNVVHVSGPGYEDTVFLAPSAFRYEDGQSTFEGRAGVIRRSAGQTRTALLDGDELVAG